jgi:hypothetical protein
MAKEKNFKKPPKLVQNKQNVLQSGLVKGNFGELLGNRSVSAGSVGSRVYGVEGIGGGGGLGEGVGGSPRVRNNFVGVRERQGDVAKNVEFGGGGGGGG